MQLALGEWIPHGAQRQRRERHRQALGIVEFAASAHDGVGSYALRLQGRGKTQKPVLGATQRLAADDVQDSGHRPGLRRCSSGNPLTRRTARATPAPGVRARPP